jgi:hypothetical protein
MNKIEDVTAAGEPLPPISQRLWKLRYRQEGSEATLSDSFRRVARAVAQPESDPEWAADLSNCCWATDSCLAGASWLVEHSHFKRHFSFTESHLQNG